MTHKQKILTITALAGLILLACNMPGNSPGPTAVAQTTAAGLTGTALAAGTATPTATVEATLTPAPTNTNIFTSTIAPAATLTVATLPCNWALFVTDISFPDDSAVQTGTNFTKTWQLKNIGSCNWTSGYQVVFVSGDQMNAPVTAALTSGVIAPGGTVDVSVPLKAPDAAGTYQGYFRLRSASAQDFGIGNNANGAFWVKIVATAPAAPPPPAAEAKPDLYVSEFSLSPATPVQGAPVHVRLGVYNQGTAAAGAYTVRWWGLSTFSNPSCSWDVPSTNARGGRILECDFTFSSWYPAKITRVIVDVNNTVAESNEGNNTADYPITVTAP